MVSRQHGAKNKLTWKLSQQHARVDQEEEKKMSLSGVMDQTEMCLRQVFPSVCEHTGRTHTPELDTVVPMVQPHVTTERLEENLFKV